MHPAQYIERVWTELSSDSATEKFKSYVDPPPDVSG